MIAMKIAKTACIVLVSAVIFSVSACEQKPATVRETVAIALKSPSDRDKLIGLLRSYAREEGMRFEDLSEEHRKLSHGTRTIYIGLWSVGDRFPGILVDDIWHIGNPRIVFISESDPLRAERRNGILVAELRKNWPDLVVIEGQRPTQAQSVTVTVH
jgi:hypothetical protein